MLEFSLTKVKLGLKISHRHPPEAFEVSIVKLILSFEVLLMMLPRRK